MLAHYPVDAESLDVGLATEGPFVTNQLFNVFATVISQYANSPVLLALVEGFALHNDAAARFDDFYSKIWNIDTAVGFGLDLWGRILGVTRVISIPASNVYFGFKTQPTAENFGHGIWYRGADASSNVALSDAVYRRVLLAKALSNISDGGIRSINRILIFLFPDQVNPRVIDNLDMTMTYKFDAPLSLPDFAITSQKNILPRSTGVTVNIVQGP